MLSLIDQKPDPVEKKVDLSFKQRKLPPNFAEDLLNLEIELEENKYTILNITKLLELYSVRFWILFSII